jgi:hypothetical protein
VSLNELPVRILVVGETKDACRLRDLLDTKDSSQFQIAHVANLELAAERLASESVRAESSPGKGAIFFFTLGRASAAGPAPAPVLHGAA